MKQESADLLDPNKKISGELPKMLRTWFDRRHGLAIAAAGRIVIYISALLIWPAT
jgi:hypothetical protein